MRHLLLPVLLTVAAGSLRGAETKAVPFATDYHAALDQAEAEGKFALLWFFDPAASSANERFEQDVLAHGEIEKQLAAEFVPVKLRVDAKIDSQGSEIELLLHPAFHEMRRLPGIAVIDMREPDGPLFRQIVSVVPFVRGPISSERMQVLLSLPRGSLTQRTLIFAVRTHVEQPASTAGELSQILTRETENHAWHQANIRLQGHHNWDQRFHAINARMPGGMLAREVCAESWPGQSLVDAAEECVHSWRQSPGHWEAVRTRHPLFAYDMKRGKNGVWYATGIFAGR